MLSTVAQQEDDEVLNRTVYKELCKNQVLKRTIGNEALKNLAMVVLIAPKFTVQIFNKESTKCC